ncbi:hypothetical protein NDU88_010927 [Pleurodeles waltl]|uniref:Uncharacterized protein n=1 Tax=Pleurodeles waltl TaxID=8319 RepID=A0AAV7S4N6_PLEWA|nr:hypothetical protein NDU88_010927 [Pleurodeles waltl]
MPAAGPRGVRRAVPRRPRAGASLRWVPRVIAAACEVGGRPGGGETQGAVVPQVSGPPEVDWSPGPACAASFEARRRCCGAWTGPTWADWRQGEILRS